MRRFFIQPGTLPRLVLLLREAIQVLARKEIKKTLILATLGFLLNLAVSLIFIAGTGLLIHQVGTSTLFYVYFTQSILALFFCLLSFFLIRRFPYKKVFAISFLFLGIVIIGLWFFLKQGAAPGWVYEGSRAFFYSMFILTDLQFWLVASHYYNNFEARRMFPILIASGILGQMTGGLLFQGLATSFHTVNFILLAGILFAIFPWVLLKILGAPSTAQTPQETQSQKESLPTRMEESKKSIISPLTWILFSFWIFYSFSSHGMDFIFNSTASFNFPQEDLLSAFLGKVTVWGMVAVLIYQIFLAPRLTLRLGVDSTIFLLPILMAIFWGIVVFNRSLSAISVSQVAIYYFTDYAAVALLHPVLNLFPVSHRGSVRIFSEGFARPLGALVLLAIAIPLSLQLNLATLSLLMFIGSLIFLAYPFIFRKIYLVHLLGCLRSKNLSLVSNAVQALGERNKKPAVSPLLSLLEQSDRIDLRKTIILTLGQIQSKDAFGKIADLFSTRNESIQLAVVESISQYKNYESILKLFHLLKSEENVSFSIRQSATIFLTRLMGKKMIPFLLELLEDPDDRIKANAIESIGLLKDRGAIPFLLPFLGHPNRRIRANIIVALYPFRKCRPQAVQCLEEMLQSEEEMAQLSAVYVIGELIFLKHEGKLIHWLKSPSKKLRMHAASALAKMKNPQFGDPFLELLQDPEATLVQEAIRHMGKFPRFSRALIFEKISQLPLTEKEKILHVLDQSPLDFTAEKALLAEKGMWAIRV